jgi:L-fucose mutarotase
MLKGIDPLLSPDLLQILAAMGHGDEILIADANFPAAALARRLCRMDGANTSVAIRAILTLLPLDQYVDEPAAVMAVVENPEAVPATETEFRSILDDAEGRKVGVQRLERFAFYERAREVFAILVTGESRLYGNIILKKGVVPPSTFKASGN